MNKYILFARIQPHAIPNNKREWQMWFSYEHRNINNRKLFFCEQLFSCYSSVNSSYRLKTIKIV